MTIKHGTAFIVGLSSDVKPVNAQEGAIFFETDTKKYAVKVGANWEYPEEQDLSKFRWRLLGRATAGSPVASLSVQNLPAHVRDLQVLVVHIYNNATTIGLRYNNISTNTYAYARSINGGAMNSGNLTYLPLNNADSASEGVEFVVVNISNEDGFAKKSIGHKCGRGTAGAGNAPNRADLLCEQAVTAPINRIDLIAATNNLGTGSEIIVLGLTDDEAYPEFWETLFAHDGRTNITTTGSVANKKYLHVLTLSFGTPRFNSDSGTNYAIRDSVNNGADTTSISQNNLTTLGGAVIFYVLNIGSQEKLIVALFFAQGGNTGTAPGRKEGVLKWANTSVQISAITFQSGAYNLRVYGSD